MRDGVGTTDDRSRAAHPPLTHTTISAASERSISVDSTLRLKRLSRVSTVWRKAFTRDASRHCASEGPFDRLPKRVATARALSCEWCGVRGRPVTPSKSASLALAFCQLIDFIIFPALNFPGRQCSVDVSRVAALSHAAFADFASRAPLAHTALCVPADDVNRHSLLCCP